MSEVNENGSEGSGEKYIAFGVCFGLLIGSGIGVIAGVLTETIATILPLLSGVGLAAGAVIGLYLENVKNV